MKITIDWKEWVWTEIKEEVKEHKRWRAEYERCYICIDSDWIILKAIDLYREEDDYRYNTWNYYRLEDEELAEEARDKLLATTRVNDRIRELNEGWECTYNKNRLKSHISYDSWKKLFFIDYCDNNNNWYILLHTKSSDIAEQIIKEHEEDLKLIYSIK